MFKPRDYELINMWMYGVLEIDNDAAPYHESISSTAHKSVSQHLTMTIQSLKLKKLTEIFKYGTSVYYLLGYKYYESRNQFYKESQLLNAIVRHLNIDECSDFIRDRSLSRDLSELLDGINELDYFLVTQRLLCISENTNDRYDYDEKDKSK